MGKIRSASQGSLGQDATRCPNPFPWDSQPPPPPCSLCEPLTEIHHDPEFLWQNQKLESLGLLAGGVAHDFNNHLLAIIGNADLLDQDLAPDSPHRKLLTEIRLAAQRAGELCTQLAAFAGKGQLQPEAVDLSATVAGMVSMLKVAVARRISLCLELTPKLPLIAGDQSQIQQVVMNLVVNAAEAIGSPGGTVTLRTGECRAEDIQSADWVLKPRQPEVGFAFLAVKDTGPGMNAASIARAFDPFYTSKPRGRGLGLASVLGIVRSHAGGVAVASAPGRGAQVTVMVPIRPALLRHAVQLPQPRTGKACGTILVVDDEEYVRMVAKRMLKRLGYTVHVAEGGAAALAMCRQMGANLDCVLLDLIMPEMDGSEVLCALSRSHPELKVLLTSGYHESEISRRFAGRGLAGFLQKPYLLDDLAGKLDKVLNGPGAAPPSASSPGRDRPGDLSDHDR